MLSMKTREVAYMLVQEGYTPSEVNYELEFGSAAYHIKRLVGAGVIVPSDPFAAKNYSYARGPNYDTLICTELCPHCENEVEILRGKISRCPKCEVWIVPCSDCTIVDSHPCHCGDCGLRLHAEQLNSKTTSDGEVVAISPGDRTSDIPSPSPGKPFIPLQEGV